jgi:hypothetical protein
MSEPKVDEIKPEKMVSRSVAIALGIICIILVAGLGVVLFIGYSPTSGSLQTTYNDYVNDHHHADEEYNQMQTNYQNELNQYNNYVNDHHHTDEDYSAVSSQNTNLSNIVNLANSTVWVNDATVSQPAGGLGTSYTSWSESASYAGYVSITVLSSTTGSTYANVVYSVYGVNYDNPINVGTSGTAYFPVLPSSSITVEVGNKNMVNGATETVTITYHY